MITNMLNLRLLKAVYQDDPAALAREIHRAELTAEELENPIASKDLAAQLNGFNILQHAVYANSFAAVLCLINQNSNRTAWHFSSDSKESAPDIFSENSLAHLSPVKLAYQGGNKGIITILRCCNLLPSLEAKESDPSLYDIDNVILFALRKGYTQVFSKVIDYIETLDSEQQLQLIPHLIASKSYIKKTYVDIRQGQVEAWSDICSRLDTAFLHNQAISTQSKVNAECPDYFSRSKLLCHDNFEMLASYFLQDDDNENDKDKLNFQWLWFNHDAWCTSQQWAELVMQLSPQKKALVSSLQHNRIEAQPTFKIDPKQYNLYQDKVNVLYDKLRPLDEEIQQISLHISEQIRMNLLLRFALVSAVLGVVTLSVGTYFYLKALNEINIFKYNYSGYYYYDVSTLLRPMKGLLHDTYFAMWLGGSAVMLGLVLFMVSKVLKTHQHTRINQTFQLVDPALSNKLKHGRNLDGAIQLCEDLGICYQEGQSIAAIFKKVSSEKSLILESEKSSGSLIRQKEIFSYDEKYRGSDKDNLLELFNLLNTATDEIALQQKKLSLNRKTSLHIDHLSFAGMLAGTVTAGVAGYLIWDAKLKMEVLTLWESNPDLSHQLSQLHHAYTLLIIGAAVLMFSIILYIVSQKLLAKSMQGDAHVNEGYHLHDLELGNKLKYSNNLQDAIVLCTQLDIESEQQTISEIFELVSKKLKILGVSPEPIAEESANEVLQSNNILQSCDFAPRLLAKNVDVSNNEIDNVLFYALRKENAHLFRQVLDFVKLLPKQRQNELVPNLLAAKHFISHRLISFDQASFAAWSAIIKSLDNSILHQQSILSLLSISDQGKDYVGQNDLFSHGNHTELAKYFQQNANNPEHHDAIEKLWFHRDAWCTTTQWAEIISGLIQQESSLLPEVRRWAYDLAFQNYISIKDYLRLHDKISIETEVGDVSAQAVEHSMIAQSFLIAADAQGIAVPHTMLTEKGPLNDRIEKIERQDANLLADENWQILKQKAVNFGLIEPEKNFDDNHTFANLADPVLATIFEYLPEMVSPTKANADQLHIDLDSAQGFAHLSAHNYQHYAKHIGLVEGYYKKDLLQLCQELKRMVDEIERLQRQIFWLAAVQDKVEWYRDKLCDIAVAIFISSGLSLIICSVLMLTMEKFAYSANSKMMLNVTIGVAVAAFVVELFILVLMFGVKKSLAQKEMLLMDRAEQGYSLQDTELSKKLGTNVCTEGNINNSIKYCKQLGIRYQDNSITEIYYSAEKLKRTLNIKTMSKIAKVGEKGEYNFSLYKSYRDSGPEVVGAEGIGDMPSTAISRLAV